MRPLLNWIERLPTEQEVAGSSPAGRVLLRPSLRKVAVGLRMNQNREG